MVDANGTSYTVYHPGVSSELSALSDTDLNNLVAGILTQFPDFSRRMIDSYLTHVSYRVPHSRLISSYGRVAGVSPHIFAATCLHRRVYSIPGPNSLVHHDGQHGNVSKALIQA